MQSQIAPRHFLRLRDVMALTGYRRSSIYAAIQTGDFPRQIKLGPKAVAWDAAEIAEWQAARMAERENNTVH